jgi:hypothetical protein
LPPRVIACAAAPSSDATHTSPSATYATRCPSGDQAGEDSGATPGVSGASALPSAITV